MRKITRRSAISVIVGTCVSSSVCSQESFAIKTRDPSGMENFTLSERLMYSTVRLEMPDGPTAIRTGTGFLYSFFQQGDKHLPAIVTNKHVFGSSNQLSFNLTVAKDDGTPDFGKSFPVRIDGLQQKIINHPEVDLSILLIGDVVEQSLRNNVKFILPFLGQAIIPNMDEFRKLAPLEAVTTLGYPGQLWDSVNNLPLFHRGSTATAPYINFQGREEFLVDFATWPGASGSPVFVLNEGGYVDARSGTTYAGRSRLYFIGVVWGVATQPVAGQLALKQAPTTIAETDYFVASQVPTNLGACLRATRLLDFEPELIRRGIQPPNGYQIRGRG